jgi:hypothetical protein
VFVLFQFLVSLLLFVGFLFSRNMKVRNHFIALYCIILRRNLELHVLYGTWCTHTEKGNNATSKSISNKCRQPCIIVSSAPRQSTDRHGRMMLSSQIVLCLLSEIKHSSRIYEQAPISNRQMFRSNLILVILHERGSGKRRGGSCILEAPNF